MWLSSRTACQARTRSSVQSPALPNKRTSKLKRVPSRDRACFSLHLFNISVARGLQNVLCCSTPNGSPLFISGSVWKGISVLWTQFPCLREEEKRGSKREEGLGERKCAFVRACENSSAQLPSISPGPSEDDSEAGGLLSPLPGSVLYHTHSVSILIWWPAVMCVLYNIAGCHRYESNPLTLAKWRWVQWHLV